MLFRQVIAEILTKKITVIKEKPAFKNQAVGFFNGELARGQINMEE
jgi:hypothetical protein